MAHRGSTQISVLQGDVVISSWSMTNNGNQSALSVTDEVRVASHIGDGAAYTVDGAFLASIPNTPGNGRDGASDGEFNYQFVGNALMRYSLDWTNPEVQFDLGVSAASWSGVTWDPVADSFWVTSVNALQGFVGNFDRSGSLLSSFTTGAGGEAGIAYDAADGTLWIGNVFGDRTYRQFSRAGAMLQSVTYDALPARSAFEGGMEFRVPLKNAGGGSGGVPTPVPEPGTWLSIVSGLGLAGALRARRPR